MKNILIASIIGTTIGYVGGSITNDTFSITDTRQSKNYVVSYQYSYNHTMVTSDIVVTLSYDKDTTSLEKYNKLKKVLKSTLPDHPDMNVVITGIYSFEK